MSSSVFRSLFVAGWALAGWLGLATLTAAQIPDQAAALPQVEEEELGEPEIEAAVEIPPVDVEIDLVELQELFDRATALTTAADAGAALPLFGHLIEVLASRIDAVPADEAARDLLARTLEQRALLSAEYGDLDASATDLERLVEVQPERETLSGGLPDSQIELFKSLRRQRTGELKVQAVEPPDLELLVDGRPRRPQDGKIRVLAGSRSVEARQAGYAPQVTELDVRAGRETRIEFELIRESAVILVQTRPAEAEVWLDGTLHGTTPLPSTAGTGLEPPEADQVFSEPLVVDAVELGLRLLEIRKPGYRPYRAELPINDLLDYPMPPVVLEPEKGVLVFAGLPRDAVVTLNGERRRVEDPASPHPRLTLPPGTYQVQIESGKARMFATELRLADRQTVEINVQLRPGLALLGVLGDDPRRSADLLQSLELALSTSGRWSLLDHSAAASELLGSLGLERRALDALARGAEPGIDWRRAQQVISERLPGMLYLLAVLRDDPISSEADLWLWAAPPGPSEPDRRRLQLGQLKDLDELRKALDASPRLYRPWLGALVVDTDAAPHPVVVDVSAESPAAAAGLTPGDQIAAFAQVPIFSRADLDARLAAVEAGEAVELGVISGQGPRTVDLKLGTSPAVLRDDGGHLRSALFTDLLLREEEAANDERWLMQLNRALLLWRADEWEEAARQLQSVRAPRLTRGLGQAAVDYWTGLTLLALGPKFEGRAAAAFERAAAVRDARLFHNDGPWLAPRARARLLALRAGGQ